ncbi:hypothetical protein [Serratia marcescens]|uniref:hypothetical protein n=1 Tax=Serratia marcescens TaxID=615 RepID=UPI003319F685
MKKVKILAVLVAISALMGCEQSDEALISQAKIGVTQLIEKNRNDLYVCQKNNDQSAQIERIKSQEFSYRAEGKCLERIYDSQHLIFDTISVKSGTVCGNVTGINSFGGKITLPFVYAKGLYSNSDRNFAVLLKNTDTMRTFQPSIASEIDKENNRLKAEFCL